MKSVILLISFVLSASAFAQDFVIKSLWKANQEHEGKQYLAVVSDRDNTYSGDKIILFGNKDGALKVRYFSLLSLNFYNQQGSDFESYDETMKLSGTVLKKNKLLRVRLESLNSGNKWSFLYSRHWSASSAQFAHNALRVASWRLNEIDGIDSPESLLDFKRMLIRLKDKMGFILEEGEDVYLPTFPLQIEQEWSITGPDAGYSSDSIRMDGMDSISREFREASRWTNYPQIPDFGPGSYSSYSKKAYGFKTKPFENGASKFVRYEITNVTWVRCGQSFEKVEAYTWILKDGSTFGYSPWLECY